MCFARLSIHYLTAQPHHRNRGRRVGLGEIVVGRHLFANTGIAGTTANTTTTGKCEKKSTASSPAPPLVCFHGERARFASWFVSGHVRPLLPERTTNRGAGACEKKVDGPFPRTPKRPKLRAIWIFHLPRPWLWRLRDPTLNGGVRG